MKLIFERSIEGLGCDILPPNDVTNYEIDNKYKREMKLNLPELTEGEISRHYTELENQTFGQNSGFYPLGSCTMKYNPKLNERVASLPGFTGIHPLQPAHTVQGALEAINIAEEYYAEITGMDKMTFQPAAGAHGEYTGILLIKKYHDRNGDTKRKNIIVPDTAHGTNPATASMAGYKAINIPSRENGLVDIEALRAVVDETTAGLMLTNPSTLGLFEKDILEIEKIIHDAGGLLYYDGANLNPIMGVARPGDMGFDIVHLNLHKTFSTPHGGGGPGSGAVGCKDFLKDLLPVPKVVGEDGKLELSYDFPDSIGKVATYYGNFAVYMRALAYAATLGKEGIREAGQNATLNANYLMKKLVDYYPVPFTGDSGICMHEFVISIEELKKEVGVDAKDIAKGLLDYNVHPPTMYFPLNVPEALMLEPTETETKETLDRAADVFIKLYNEAKEDPEALKQAPKTTFVRRPDEVRAARTPILRYDFDKED